MTPEILEIFTEISSLLKKHEGTLRFVQDSADKVETTGTIETMQGKKKVPGMYFASVIPKPKDVRLYFFPIYTHVEAFADLSPSLRKCLKGKSCFHIKKIDEVDKRLFSEMIDRGIKIYQENGWLTRGGSNFEDPK